MSNFPLDRSSLVSLFVESILWGLFECLYMITLYLLLQKRSNLQKNTPYIIFITIIFTLCTTHAIISFLRLSRAFINAERPVDYLANMTDTLYRLKYGFLFIEIFLSDLLIISRCFHLWNKNYIVAVIPGLMSLGTLVSAGGALHAMVSISNTGDTSSAQVTSWMTASLVVFRVRQIHNLITANINRHVKVYTIILVLIESGFLSLITTLILLPTVATQNNAHYIMCDVSSPVAGLTVGLIICGMTVNMSNTSHVSSISSRAAGIQRFSIAPNVLPQRPKKTAAGNWNEYDDNDGIHSPTLSNSPSMQELKGAVQPFPTQPVMAV
ncbi:hypothetical protein Clacol_007427 [Clathrus columnatus]|uniref:Uncharacterized protein n=1 Tax=Clathrus columnatus TaxID=1419009 RepID=A0AAV5AL62_9AGAM|nr:hypothetical protein Clacol_007427 [Clathrus columnatus]